MIKVRLELNDGSGYTYRSPIYELPAVPAVVELSSDVVLRVGHSRAQPGCEWLVLECTPHFRGGHAVMPARGRLRDLGWEGAD